MGRICNGPRLLWAEFVMGRDVLEPSRGVVVFDGTATEKTGPKDGTKFCGPRHEIIKDFFACISLIGSSLKCIFKLSLSFLK